MRRERRLGIIGAGIITLLGGITTASSATAGAAWLQTPTPTPDVLVLFQDDFATYSNRWPENSSPKAAVAYRDGTLTMRVVSPGVSIWALPDFAITLDQYSIQVTASFHEGSLDSLFGFVLGYQDDENFYALMVSPDGTWRYLQRDHQEWIDLTPPQAVSVVVSAEHPPVRLRAEVTADKLILFIDDNPVGTVALKDKWPGGKIGLIARAGHGYVDVSFDDVVITNITE